MATCFLIDSRPAAPVCAVARFAQLRELRVLRCRDIAAVSSTGPASSLIAIGASRLHELSNRDRKHLANCVEGGSTLYVRGLPNNRTSLDLKPFASLELPISPEYRASACRFTTSGLLPAALAGEATTGVLFEGYGVEHRSAQDFEELVVMRHIDRVERTSVFALRYGQGCVIYDLHREERASTDLPPLARMAHRECRHQDIGALVAVNRVSGDEWSQPPSFNIVIDDRPVNYDHFNAVAVTRFLRHISELCPGAHTDFAWTPCHTSVSRAYVQAMKLFPTGFVWHGLYRHVDHRMLLAPEQEYERGRRMVTRLERRFGIRFQPLMVFPFERSAQNQFPLLARSGFLASVEEPHHPSCSEPDSPAYLDDARPSRVDSNSGLTVLFRYPATSLTRDRMLGMAALGLPIIAAAHPEDIGLKRFSRFLDRGGDASYLDEILRFAYVKKLPSRSLEEIVKELPRLGSQADRQANNFRAAAH